MANQLDSETEIVQMNTEMRADIVARIDEHAKKLGTTRKGFLWQHFAEMFGIELAQEDRANGATSAA